MVSYIIYNIIKERRANYFSPRMFEEPTKRSKFISEAIKRGGMET
jgi:hypothetical protein